MTDKADQYQTQNAVKDNLIQILQDIISEQEQKIETLENHIKGRVRTHHNPAKPSSIARLFEAVQVAHKETNRIHQMWLDADNERVKFKTQVWQLEKKLREAKTFIVELQTASSVGVLLLFFQSNNKAALQSPIFNPLWERIKSLVLWVSVRCTKAGAQTHCATPLDPPL